MRAVVQRVLKASVSVDGQVVSQIGPGLLCLIGLSKGDETDSDARDYIARKILNGRVFKNEDTGKMWDQSVVQRSYEVLLVSQFTLAGKFKGNKPTFHTALGPAEAKSAYEDFVRLMGEQYRADKIKDGVFGAMMEVSLVNDGPVTLVLDSNDR